MDIGAVLSDRNYEFNFDTVYGIQADKYAGTFNINGKIDKTKLKQRGRKYQT